MANEPRYPNTDGKPVDKQLQELKDYTINLQRYVRWALRNIGTKNMDRATADTLRNIKGAVTFEDLIGEGTTEINGANITTGSISAERLDLSSTHGLTDGSSYISKLTGGVFECQWLNENGVNELDNVINFNGMSIREGITGTNIAGCLLNSGKQIDLYSSYGVNITSTDGGIVLSGDSIDITPALPVSSGGTGRTSFTSGYFLTGNNKSIQLTSPSSVLSKIGAQKEMAFATARTASSGVSGGDDIDLRTFLGTSTSVFTNARYSSTYGYGIKCIKAGKYLISATANLQLNATLTSAATVTVAIREVAGGTSTYIMKGNHTFPASSSGHAITLTLVPQVVTLEANSYLSLYNSLSTVVTKAEGCWITAIYLGS